MFAERIPFKKKTRFKVEFRWKEKYGVPKQSITSKLKPHCYLEVNIPSKPPQTQKIADLYNSGQSINEISKLLHQSKKRVRGILVKLGILSPIPLNSRKPEKKVLRGKVRWNSPYGFKYELGKLIKHPQEHETLHIVITLRQTGKNAREIADYLNEQKLRPRIAKKWDRCTVHRILEWHESNHELLQEVAWVSKN
jgi:hypothetical protein